MMNRANYRYPLSGKENFLIAKMSAKLLNVNVLELPMFDKVFYLPLFVISWAFILITNLEHPRFIAVAFILFILGGASRHGIDVLNGSRASALMALANVAVSLAVGWLGLLIAAFFLSDSERLDFGLYAIGLACAIFAKELLRGLPILSAKWTARRAGIELTPEEIGHITNPNQKPKRPVRKK